MPQPAQQIVFQEPIHPINDASGRLERLTQAMHDALPGWKWEPVVRALMSLRGMQELTAMTLVAEAGDMSRFKEARQLMNFFGLTPSEHSSGGKRVQGGITKCGNAHCRRVLTEAAWHYRLKPMVSEAMQKRQEKQSKEVCLIAWKAQQRLHKRFKRLAQISRHNRSCPGEKHTGNGLPPHSPSDRPSEGACSRLKNQGQATGKSRPQKQTANQPLAA